MNSLHDLDRRPVNQAETGSAVMIEPVRDVVDAVLRLDLEIASVGLRDVERSEAVIDLVTIHVQRHAAPSAAGTSCPDGGWYAEWDSVTVVCRRSRRPCRRWSCGIGPWT